MRQTFVAILVAAAAGSTVAQAGETSPPPAPTPTTGWTRIAMENDAFNVPAGTMVRYGAGTAFVQREVSGAGECSNGFFGRDPAVNVVKACEVFGAGAAPAPAPAALRAPELVFRSMQVPQHTTPAPPAPGAVTYHFRDCQVGASADCVPGKNSNAGTETAPKQNLAGINVNALPAGSRLLFARGGAWNWSRLMLENPRVTPDNPLVFDAYGTGERPLFNAPNLKSGAVDFGPYNNTTHDGGYSFRNIVWDGHGSSAHAFFMIHNLRNVTIEGSRLTRFHIAIHAQARGPHGITHVVIRNNEIVQNGNMGILGQFSDSVIEDNLFEANNAGGSGFDHGTYLSGHAPESGVNIVLRNNRYIRNSVVNGTCRGGNMTFHGQMDNVLIEGNRIEQDSAAPGCWLMSITQGYNTAEWFRNFVVRNNKFINGGNTGMNAQSAPGIVVEGNVVINTQRGQVGLSVGHMEYGNGDVPDGNAIVRNNTGCYPGPGTGNSLVRVIAPNSVVSNNVTLTGAAATTGVCAK